MILQVETLPYRRQILSLRWIAVSEWVLGIRSLFLIVLPSHLPQEIQILQLFGSSGLLSHAVFWHNFLMRPTIPILQYQQSECLPSIFSPRSKRNREKFLVISFFQIDEFLLCLSLLEFGRYSTCAPHGTIGPLNDSPNLRRYGVVPSVRRSWTLRRQQ